MNSEERKDFDYVLMSNQSLSNSILEDNDNSLRIHQNDFQPFDENNDESHVQYKLKEYWVEIFIWIGEIVVIGTIYSVFYDSYRYHRDIK